MEQVRGRRSDAISKRMFGIGWVAFVVCGVAGGCHIKCMLGNLLLALDCFGWLEGVRGAAGPSGELKAQG